MKGNIFIKRPVMALSISVLILIVGFISLYTLPVEQYPDIAPPTVRVEATYTGANADAVMNSVIMPLEESINGVENMIYITSTATNAGTAEILVYFKQGTDPDMAAVNVQNRVSAAQGLLPSEVTAIGVSTMKRQNSFLQINSLISPDKRYDETFLANYLDINVIPQVKRIQGVGDVQLMGDTYSMRIWMKPDKMAQYGLVPSDVTAVLGEQNTEAPTGLLGESSDNVFQYTMKYKGRLKSVEEFGNMVIRSQKDGSVLRVKDIAEVELGRESYSFHGEADGVPGVTFMVFQVAGANATAVNQEISDLLDDISKDLPEGTEFIQMMSVNDFLFASIDNVVETLVIAIILVVLVVYFFLHDFKSTLIPSISIIVSLIGTFAFLSVAGFSINILTLFALVLAIGTVVDDAIIVVEAVQAKFDVGYRSSYLATKDAMSDVTMAVVSCTFVFMAVFIPVTFMGGTSGVFYTQFGITMAVAVGLSCINALTLCPALCAMMMKASDTEKSIKSFSGRIRAAYTVSFNTMLGKYKKGLMFFFHHRWTVWASLGVATVLLVYLMSTTKTGLVPQEDQGTMMINISTSPGNSLAETNKVMDKVQDILKATPEIEHYSRITGYGLISGQGTSYGTVIIRLYHWDERKGKEHSVEAVMKRLNAQFSEIKEAQVFCFQPAMIPGYGTGNAVELCMEDKTGGDMQPFHESVQKFIMTLNERPEVAMAYSSYAMNFPQIAVDVDAAKCKRAGISPSDVLDVVGAYCGGSYVSNYNKYGKVYRVMIQASPDARLNQHALDNMFVRNGTEMAPVSQFVTLRSVLGPEIAKRFNLYNTIDVNVNVAEGYSTGEVQKAIKEVAAQVLPSGYGYEYGGMAREEASSGGAQTVFIYTLCVVLIYLILSCLYESFLVPLAVILSVPFGLMGSFLFARVAGLENNIYLQTGAIMLIGLLAKTAILITEYAIERRRKGMGIISSTYSAAQARFRPIIMTVLCMIFGMLPLMFSSGAGANGNSSLATGVVGGMLIGTLALLFVVPENLYGEEVTVSDTVSIGNIHWRDFFTDPYLQDLIEKGLAQNTDVQTASLRVEEAKASLLSAKLAFLPSFALSPQGGVNTVEGSKASHTYTLPVTASWELDVFGKLRNAKRQAKAAYLQSEDYKQAVYSSLIANIANTYYTLLMLDEQLEISRQTADTWKETVESTQALMDAGQADEAAVSQMRATYYEVENSVMDLEEQINQVENSLSLLLAETPHKMARGKLSGQQFTSRLSVGVPLQMLSNRPDVRMAERDLEQAFYVTNQANSAFYPSITLSGSAGWTNSVGGLITNPGKFVTSALASLTQPLFNRGTLIARRRIAKAQQEEALLAFEQKLLDAGTEVNEALVSYQISKRKKDNYENQVAALEKAFTSTSLLMQHGNTTYLEVLTARQTLLNAQLSQTANCFKEIQSLINLYQSLGGGQHI